jgi:hypothetical protein
VPRLSIVIPNPSFDSSVEDTLVSVLQNRPEYSEVIVVTAQPYEDPYGLGREVRFLTTDSVAGRVDLINYGCRQASGDVIHLLLPGTIATDGWTDHIWRHFRHDHIGAVAAVLLQSENAQRAMAAGVAYLPRGERRVVGGGIGVEDHRMVSLSVLAPVLAGGFYRRELILALQGFDGSFGESLADVELGLALRDLGMGTVVESRSRLVSGRLANSAPRNFAEARQAERLFRQRQASYSGKWRHRLYVAAEMVRGFPHPRMIARVMGRLAACRDTDSRSLYQSRLQQAREELAQHTKEVATIPIGLNAIPIRTRRRLAA